ncbi:sterol desaturase family protein [Aquimarina sediminis]|uniref:sterol desaturase family protein n=1 Tax=Aquimarina sediminis TaxID=2070536 RepID=UPI0013E8A62D|nr:sterol desaturase family protein [Aquimarina sediminis]
MMVQDFLNDLQNPFIFWGMLLFANVAMFLCTILISYFWSSFYKHKKLPIEKKDVILAIGIMLINVIVAIPGYLLFVNSKIIFTQDHVVRDFVLLFVVVDFVMYVFHYASHYVWPFRLIHEEHHRHYSFNEISLYVMHPIEALSFGLILTILPFLVSLNFYSFTFFLLFNWFIGVLAHLNTSSNKQVLLFGNNIFHRDHHEHSKYNFGFYTIIWDKIFGTYYNAEKVDS